MPHAMSNAATISASGSIICDMQCFIRNLGVQPQSLPSRSSAIPRVCLPDPPSLSPFLIAIGAERHIAKEMDRVYNARALELRSYYEISINKAFAALPDFSFQDDSDKRILDAFASLYLTKVRSWIDDGLAAYRSRQKSRKLVVSNAEVPGGANPRRAFNTDYIPLLEHFFHGNPFPTHADKTFLAKKSGMTYRQIHVWFQNRRNRTKKANGVWRKNPVGESEAPPPDSLCERHGNKILRSSHFSDREITQERCIPEILSHDENSATKDDNVLDRCTAPLHAFPSPYPPVCVHESFPLGSRNQMFSAVQWTRLSNHNTPSQSCKIDVDDLADRFSLLNVRDSRSRRSQRNCRAMQSSQAVATNFITVAPSPAPHPALIKPKQVTALLGHRSPFPIVRTSQPTSQVFVGPTASSSPVLPSSASSRRKVAPLPKRHFRQFPLTCRNWTPTSSDLLSSALSPDPLTRSLSESFDLRMEIPSCPVLAH